MCWHRPGFLSQVPLPIGAFLVLMPFMLQQHQKSVEETFMLLQGVSLERSYEDWQLRQTRWDCAVFVLLWLGAVGSTALSHHFANDGLWTAQVALHFLLTALFSCVILSLAYSAVFVCRSLRIMVDAFCCDVVQTQLGDVAHIWNLTQAVLRKASTAVESSLLVLCLVLAISVPLFLVDVSGLAGASAPIPSLLPGLLVTCGSLYLLFLAAAVSEQCAQVPALINAISFGDGMELERQQTVLYITSSAAGFYVFGTRLTFAMVVKLVYVWCIVVVGSLSRVLAVGQN